MAIALKFARPGSGSTWCRSMKWSTGARHPGRPAAALGGEDVSLRLQAGERSQSRSCPRRFAGAASNSVEKVYIRQQLEDFSSTMILK